MHKDEDEEDKEPEEELVPEEGEGGEEKANESGSEEEGGKGKKKGKQAKSSARKAKPKSEKKPKKEPKPRVVFRKGKYNDRIEAIVEKSEQRESDDSEIKADCCVKCTNKEFIRAALSGNQKLMEKLLQSECKVSTLLEKWGIDYDPTALEILFTSKNKEVFIKYLEELNVSTRRIRFTSPKQCLLQEIQTGYNAKYAYGVVTRKVQMGRGGKEGNNAFAYDVADDYEDSYNQDLYLLDRVLEIEDMDPELLDIMELKWPDFANLLRERAAIAVRCGNVKVAAHIIKKLFENQGYGYNQLHYEVLSCKQPSELTPFKPQSVTKKPLGKMIVFPIHCAAINANQDILQNLIDKVDGDTSQKDELGRRAVHYAAVCEGPGPL